MNDFTERVTGERLTDGERLAIPSPHAKNHNLIEFSARLISFDAASRLTVSHGKTGPWCSAYAVIDAEAVSVYDYPGKERLLERIPHGLTLSDFVGISIAVERGFTAELTLTTASGSFSRQICWNGSQGDILAEVLGATLSDCSLTYTLGGVERELWLFGDSYFDFWCRCLADRGLGDFYLDGHSGRTSRGALASLRAALTRATPRRLVWMMGMNDPDGEEVSPAWLECYHALRDLCRERDITLILATVPNTPIRNHTYKNEIVRESGCRYLDINAAVGADADTAWREGLLSADRVHPTAEGAEVIAEYILSNLFEIGEES